MRRNDSGQPVYWELTDPDGWTHDPANRAELFGPGAAAPQVDVYDGEVVVQGRDQDGQYQLRLNRGAARWLGVRLIEAAALQEVLTEHKQREEPS